MPEIPLKYEKELVKFQSNGDETSSDDEDDSDVDNKNEKELQNEQRGLHREKSREGGRNKR